MVYTHRTKGKSRDQKPRPSAFRIQDLEKAVTRLDIYAPQESKADVGTEDSSGPSESRVASPSRSVENPEDGGDALGNAADRDGAEERVARAVATRTGSKGTGTLSERSTLRGVPRGGGTSGDSEDTAGKQKKPRVQSGQGRGRPKRKRREEELEETREREEASASGEVGLLVRVGLGAATSGGLEDSAGVAKAQTRGKKKRKQS